MAPKQAQLTPLLEALAAETRSNPIHFHFGFITSDLGAASQACPQPGDDAGLRDRGVSDVCLGPEFLHFIDFDPLGDNNLPIDSELGEVLACLSDQGEKG